MSDCKRILCIPFQPEDKELFIAIRKVCPSSWTFHALQPEEVDIRAREYYKAVEGYNFEVSKITGGKIKLQDIKDLEERERVRKEINKLTKPTKPDVLDFYALLNQRVRLYRESFIELMLEECKYDLVITSLSCHIFASQVIEAATRKNIPTLEVVGRGVIASESLWQSYREEDYSSGEYIGSKFKPLTDMIACWSPHHKEVLQQRGVDENNLVITGNPCFDQFRSLDEDGEEYISLIDEEDIFREKINAKTEDCIISCFLQDYMDKTLNLSWEQRYSLATHQDRMLFSLLRFVDKNDGYFLYINDYSRGVWIQDTTVMKRIRRLSAIGKVCYDGGGLKLSNVDTLFYSDLVVSSGGDILFKAVLLNRPVLLVSSEDAVGFNKQGGIPIVSTKEELRLFLEQEDYPSVMLNQEEKDYYFHRFLPATWDNLSGKRVALVMNYLMEKDKHLKQQESWLFALFKQQNPTLFNPFKHDLDSIMSKEIEEDVKEE